jgi:hypothetical protein
MRFRAQRFLVWGDRWIGSELVGGSSSRFRVGLGAVGGCPHQVSDSGTVGSVAWL